MVWFVGVIESLASRHSAWNNGLEGVLVAAPRMSDGDDPHSFVHTTI